MATKYQKKDINTRCWNMCFGLWYGIIFLSSYFSFRMILACFIDHVILLEAIGQERKQAIKQERKKERKNPYHLRLQRSHLA